MLKAEILFAEGSTFSYIGASPSFTEEEAESIDLPLTVEYFEPVYVYPSWTVHNHGQILLAFYRSDIDSGIEAFKDYACRIGKTVGALSVIQLNRLPGSGSVCV